jgi:hypothetical protein
MTLRSVFEAEQIYVAARTENSVVPFGHLTKAFREHSAVLTLCRAGFGSEAFALSRSMLEMAIALRWITNGDQVERSKAFAYFEAKRKQYFATIFAKYNPGNPLADEAVQYVDNLYRQYAEKYKSFRFWSDAASSLRRMAEEPEILGAASAAPQNTNDLWRYEVPYSMASDHVHCNAVALADSFPPVGSPYEVTQAEDPKLVRDAAFSSTQWLFTIAIRVDTYRQLGMGNKIDTAYKPFALFLKAHP